MLCPFASSCNQLQKKEVWTYKSTKTQEEVARKIQVKSAIEINLNIVQLCALANLNMSFIAFVASPLNIDIKLYDLWYKGISCIVLSNER